MATAGRVLIVDPDPASREALGERLRSLGHAVALAADGAEAAYVALADPPAAVVADLAMPSISGVQLCRLLQAEAGTRHVPVVLRGEEGRRNRYWAEQAGACAYVVKGRTGDLVRALRKALPPGGSADDGFFLAVPSEADIRDRIAYHLDRALFEMVLASEVRRLGACDSFPQLFDLLAQLVAQVTAYRWLALHPADDSRAGLHANPAHRAEAEAAARSALGGAPGFVALEDADAEPGRVDEQLVCADVAFADRRIGRIALAPVGDLDEAESLVRIVARELGSPLRTVLLLEETRRLATTDPLTGRLNRRAFVALVEREVVRSHRYGDPLSVVVLDVDHFKAVNDSRGHSGGDAVLAALGALLGDLPRRCDLAARWGGEEFVVALPATPLDRAEIAAERLRTALAALAIPAGAGEPLRVTASFGVAELRREETLEALLDRADRALYRAKDAGRDRVVADRSGALGLVSGWSEAG